MNNRKTITIQFSESWRPQNLEDAVSRLSMLFECQIQDFSTEKMNCQLITIRGVHEVALRLGPMLSPMKDNSTNYEVSTEEIKISVNQEENRILVSAQP